MVLVLDRDGADGVGWGWCSWGLWGLVGDLLTAACALSSTGESMRAAAAEALLHTLQAEDAPPQLQQQGIEAVCLFLSRSLYTPSVDSVGSPRLAN